MTDDQSKKVFFDRKKKNCNKNCKYHLVLDHPCSNLRRSSKFMGKALIYYNNLYHIIIESKN